MRAMKPCSYLWPGVVAGCSSIFGCLTAGAQVRITEVNLSTRAVEVTNFGSSSVNLSGWFFCHQLTYPPLSGSIAAGESRQFTVNFSQTASDLCLYNSSVFTSTSAMQDFVQWGSGGHGRESVAVSKGIWTSGFFLALPSAGKSFHARGLSTTGSRTGNWFVGWPNPAVFPVPPITIGSSALVAGEWRLTAQSPYLTEAHRVDVNGDLSANWQQVGAPAITELGNGLIEVRFPATGTRQFARLRAEL
jgi:hypothetical protein